MVEELGTHQGDYSMKSSLGIIIQTTMMRMTPVEEIG